MRPLIALISFILIPMAQAAIQTKAIEYKHGDTVLEGFLVWDDAVATEKTPKPGVVVCPEWWGMNDYSKARAKQLAELGYVAFAIDMYGKGKVTEDAKQAGQWAGELSKDPQVRRDRAAAGMKVLTDQNIVDKSKVAAIGYCMGGTVALELARTGADLKAVVAFHASQVSAAKPEDNKKIKGTVLVCHGQDDAFVQPGEIEKFHAQMKEAGIDYVFVAYSGAVHAFTNPNADKFKVPGVSYNVNADKRSWAEMKEIFAEKFGPTKTKS